MRILARTPGGGDGRSPFPSPADLGKAELTPMTATCASVRLREVFLYEAEQGVWLRFVRPLKILMARRNADVMPQLRALDQALSRGCYVAGFIAYEAGPAFDPGVKARRDSEFPRMVFGVFRAPEVWRELPGSEETEADVSGPTTWRPDISESHYRACLHRIRTFIRWGHTYQVNFTLRLRTLAPSNGWAFFRRLVAAQEAPYAAWVDLGGWQILSASPELFFRLDGHRIVARPMKGTAPRGLWHEQDLQQAARLRRSEKNRAENVMIVDMVRNDLGRIAQPGSVRVVQLYTVERYPTVWQMTSTVEARTAAPLAEIFRALFPPASVTGAPKCRTTQIIAALESAPRRIYTGTVGFAGPSRQAQFNVAIRTVLIDPVRGKAEYGVGGGIVWDSETGSEYHECLLKARVLARARPEFDLLETFLWTPRSGYRFLGLHLRRLANSAIYFGFRFDPSETLRRLRRAAGRFRPHPYRVRCRVSRGGGVAVEATPWPKGPPPWGNVALGLRPVDPEDPFLYHKTTYRHVYEQALADRPGFSDVLLFNVRGEITESTMANVAIRVGRVLYTPPICCGLLPGTYRAWLLGCGRLRERPVLVDEIREHPHVYLFSSVRGWASVRVVMPT